MIARKKHQAAFFLLLALVGLILLGLSLPGLSLQAGLPIPGGDTLLLDQPALPAPPPTARLPLPWLAQGVLALAFVLVVIAFIANLMRRSSLKRIGVLGLGLALLVLLLNLLPRIAPAVPASFPGDTPGEPPPMAEYDIAPIGEPPALLFRLVMALLLLVLLLVFFWMLSRGFWRATREDLIAAEAASAARALAGGGDLRSIIVRCYLNMEVVLRAERGLERQAAVTPREFETFLVARGIPAAPVGQLTRLFEKVRYSSQPPGWQDEEDAASCLSAIQTACRPLDRREP